MTDDTQASPPEPAKRKSKLPEFQGEDKVYLGDYVKKKRRWAFFWGFLVSLIIWCIVQASMNLEPEFPPKKNHIAEISITGGIFEDEYRMQMFRELREREDVRALIVRINSGGGAVYPAEQVFQELRKISEDIPVVTVMEDVAASAAYIISLGSDHIIAGETTITGSIGVIAEMLNLSDVLDKWGVETTLVRSSESKGGLSPLRDPTPEELADERALIDNLYNWFRDLVGERRDLSGSRLDQVANGRVFTGAQAVRLGLIDQIGGYDEAIAYLEAENEGLQSLDIEQWEPLYPIYEAENFWGAMIEAGIQRAIRSLTLTGQTQYLAK